MKKGLKKMSGEIFIDYKELAWEFIRRSANENPYEVFNEICSNLKDSQKSMVWAEIYNIRAIPNNRYCRVLTKNQNQIMECIL